PMCATVCPSGALTYATREEIEQLRKRSRPVNQFQFGRQTISTKVNMMVPRASTVERVDVTSAMHEPPTGRSIALNVLTLDEGRRSHERFPGRTGPQLPRRPAACPAAALAARLPDRHPRRRCAVPAGVHEIPGADQRGVRRRAVLDRDDEPVARQRADARE